MAFLFRNPFPRTIRPLLALVLVFLTACAASAPALAQEKKVAQKNGVDISKMGAYRALAQHMYLDFQKGDLAAAAELGTVLERLWDKAEEYGAIPLSRRSTANSSIKSIKPWTSSSPRSRKPRASHPMRLA